MKRLYLTLLLLVVLFTSSVFSVSATGGTITYNGLYTVHTFTSNGELIVSEDGDVEVLVIAGGGGGGAGYGAGGGGGGTWGAGTGGTASCGGGIGGGVYDDGY